MKVFIYQEMIGNNVFLERKLWFDYINRKRQIRTFSEKFNVFL